MQRLEVSGAVRLICKSLGVKGLTLKPFSKYNPTNDNSTKFKIQSAYAVSCPLPNNYTVNFPSIYVPYYFTFSLRIHKGRAGTTCPSEDKFFSSLNLIIVSVSTTDQLFIPLA